MALTEGIRVGDYGTRVEVVLQQNGSVADISSATTREILFEKPDGSSITKSATFTTDGTDGKIYYDIESGVLDLPGIWRVQGRIATGAGSWKSSIGSFSVDRNIP